MYQHFFNIFPSSTGFVTAISPTQPSLLGWKYQVTLISSPMTPAHHQWISEPNSPMTSAPAHYFENAWPKLLRKCNSSHVTSLIHSQSYQNHRASWICHHTAPSHSTNPPIYHGSFFWWVFVWFTTIWLCICTTGAFLPILAQHQILVQPQSLLSSCYCL